VDANRVRQRPTETPKGWVASNQEKVEVKCWKGEDDPMFWAEGLVTGDRQGYFLVQLTLKGGKLGRVEMVGNDRLRPAFSHMKTDKDISLQFHRYVIRLPDSLYVAPDLETLRAKSGAGSLYYDEVRGSCGWCLRILG
jgi:hypothetical protein